MVEADVVDYLEISGKKLIANTYIDNDDGTVTDTKTGLQWMRFALGQKWRDGGIDGEIKVYTWNDASSLVARINNKNGYAGFTDWRLPLKDELLSLVKKQLIESQKSSYVQSAFPNASKHTFWTGSIHAKNLGNAWVVYLGSVYACYSSAINHEFSVRLVRGDFVNLK